MCLPYRVMEHEEWSEPNWLRRFAQITRDHCRIEGIRHAQTSTALEAAPSLSDAQEEKRTHSRETSDGVLASLKLYCPTCDEEREPDPIDVVMGTVPSCTECGEFLSTTNERK